MGWDCRVLGVAAVLAVLPAGAAQPATKSAEAQILFANQGGIQDWRAVDDKGVYLRGQDGQWYYATLFASCFGLRTARGIAFVPSPGGSFDRSSAVLVGDSRCPVVSLVKSGPPPKP